MAALPAAAFTLAVFIAAAIAPPALAADKPNILVIWGDDIGY